MGGNLRQKLKASLENGRSCIKDDLYELKKNILSRIDFHGIKFSAFLFSVNFKHFFMISSSARQQRERIETRTLAPVIPMRSAPKENDKPGRKVSKLKEDVNLPQFYTKPIFRTKKY